MINSHLTQRDFKMAGHRTPFETESIELYAQGWSLREVKAILAKDGKHISIEGIRTAIRRKAPGLIRVPFKGMGMAPGLRLAVQGT